MKQPIVRECFEGGLNVLFGINRLVLQTTSIQSTKMAHVMQVQIDYTGQLLAVPEILCYASGQSSFTKVPSSQNNLGCQTP
jgi:hypothetical protein